MKSLTQYGRMAEKHWREHRPQMVRDLERKGLLQQMLLEAEDKTKDEMATLRAQLIKQGATPQQAHDQAWEMLREKYILLPPEE
jgi:hypothetical protein